MGMIFFISEVVYALLLCNILLNGIQTTYMGSASLTQKSRSYHKLEPLSCGTLKYLKGTNKAKEQTPESQYQYNTNSECLPV